MSALFNTPRENRYWIYALLTIIAIFATLFMGRPLQQMLRDQNVQAGFFLTGMLLTALAILFHGLKVRPTKHEFAVWFGLAAVYLMLFFRLGAPERSHLIEFSVLAVFIHKALLERQGTERNGWKPAIFAFFLTVAIGIIDESLQLVVPNRHFTYEDILFNALAAFMAISGSMVLQWAGNKFRPSKHLPQ